MIDLKDYILEERSTKYPKLEYNGTCQEYLLNVGKLDKSIDFLSYWNGTITSIPKWKKGHLIIKCSDAYILAHQTFNMPAFKTHAGGSKNCNLIITTEELPWDEEMDDYDFGSIGGNSINKMFVDAMKKRGFINYTGNTEVSDWHPAIIGKDGYQYESEKDTCKEKGYPYKQGDILYIKGGYYTNKVYMDKKLLQQYLYEIFDHYKDKLKP